MVTINANTHQMGRGDGQGPKFCLNIENTEYEWDEPTISFEDIARLGGWDPAQGVIQINEDNTEETLEPGQTVELKPGRGFCRKISWKRGLDRTDRIDEDILLLRSKYPDLEVKDNWIFIPNYPLPDGWNRSQSDVVIEIKETYPVAPPYGIYVPSSLRFQDALPRKFREKAEIQPPFEGEWGIFSWQGDDAEWRASSNIEQGANLLRWAQSFAVRFAEGV